MVKLLVPLVGVWAACSTAQSGWAEPGSGTLCEIGPAGATALVAQYDNPYPDPYGRDPRGWNPHGDDPHGEDPHDEYHDPNLPSNEKELERRGPLDDPYGGNEPYYPPLPPSPPPAF